MGTNRLGRSRRSRRVLRERASSVGPLDPLSKAGRAPDLYRLTDYYWMVIHRVLEMYCDLHNDEATGIDGRVGPYGSLFLRHRLPLGPDAAQCRGEGTSSESTRITISVGNLWSGSAAVLPWAALSIGCDATAPTTPAAPSARRHSDSPVAIARFGRASMEKGSRSDYVNGGGGPAR